MRLFECTCGRSLFGIKDTMFFEYLDNNRDGGVDWVGDDEHECLWRCGRDSVGKITNDAGIYLNKGIRKF
jgi:hypothetical protein